MHGSRLFLVEVSYQWASHEICAGNAIIHINYLLIFRESLVLDLEMRCEWLDIEENAMQCPR